MNEKSGIMQIIHGRLIKEAVSRCAIELSSLFPHDSKPALYAPFNNVEDGESQQLKQFVQSISAKEDEGR